MGFSNYLLTVTLAALAAVVADVVNSAVSKRTKGLEKYIKFGITLCVVSCMIMPLLKLSFSDIKIIPDAVQTDAANSDNDSLYILERECEGALSEELISKTGIKPVEVIIEMKWDNDCPEIVKALIVLPKGCDDHKNTVDMETEKALGLKAEIIMEETYEGNNTEKS